MTHFLQSTSWEQFQHSLGKRTIRQSGDTWSYMAIIESSRININHRLYCPFGPLVTNTADLVDATASLKLDALKHRSSYIRIEPIGDVTPADLTRLGYKKVKASQPEHTWCIDLAPEESDIVANMSQPNRNIYRNFAKKGMALHSSVNPDDIGILTSLLKSVASRNSITIHPDIYFYTQAKSLMEAGAATLYWVSYQNESIAAALVYDSDTTRYYAHAAASQAHRNLNPGAVIVSTMIIDAKRKGLTTVDLYGITESDKPNHPWYGFTKFKKSFGGYAVDYVGRWELPVKRIRYRLYRTALLAYRTVRK